MYDPSHKKIVPTIAIMASIKIFTIEFFYETHKNTEKYFINSILHMFFNRKFDCRFENFDCRFLLSFSPCLLFENFYFHFDTFIVG
jgi:hypothetical protein